MQLVYHMWRIPFLRAMMHSRRRIVLLAAWNPRNADACAGAEEIKRRRRRRNELTVHGEVVIAARHLSLRRTQSNENHLHPVLLSDASLARPCPSLFLPHDLKWLFAALQWLWIHFASISINADYSAFICCSRCFCKRMFLQVSLLKVH